MACKPSRIKTGGRAFFVLTGGFIMEQNQRFLLEKPVFPLLVSMAVPVMLSMLINSLYNVVDNIWVSRLGTDAITAVSLAFPLQNIIMALGVGLGVGVSSLISMSLGAGNRNKADHLASAGLSLALIHCLLFIALGIFITRPFLGMFTDNPQIFEWACSYTFIVLCLSSGQVLQMYMEKLFQGVGRMKTTMFLMASGCLINIVLDPILIFGWFGAPAMGVSGAAVATVIGQFGALLLYILVYLKTNLGVSIRPRLMNLNRELIRSIYSIAIPSSLLLAMPSLLTGILNGILTTFGSVYVAAFGLYFKLQTFVNLPCNGLLQGMRPIIGYNYGAERHDRVRSTIRCSLGLVTVVTLTGTIASIFFPGPILRIFDADPELMQYGTEALRMIGPSFLISSVAFIAAGVFEALGQGRPSLIISLLRQLVIIVPLGWILSRFMGPAGIWISFPIAELIAAVIAWKMMGKIYADHPENTH